MTVPTFEVPCARCVDHPGLLALGSLLLCRTCNGTKVQMVSESVFLSRYGVEMGQATGHHILAEGYREPPTEAAYRRQVDSLHYRVARGGALTIDEMVALLVQSGMARYDISEGDDGPGGGIPPRAPLPPAIRAPEPSPRPRPEMLEPRWRMLEECRAGIAACHELLDRILEPEGQPKRGDETAEVGKKGRSRSKRAKES